MTFFPDRLKDAIFSLQAPDLDVVLLVGFDFLFTAFAIWMALAIGLVATTGQTIGGRLFTIQVVNMKGQPPKFHQVVCRAFALVTTMLTFCIGFLPAFGPKRRALHDYIADTQVVRTVVYQEIYDDLV